VRRIYIVQRLYEKFCRHQLGPFDLWCYLDLRCLYGLFCLDDLCIGDREVLKSPTTTMLEFIYVFKSFRVSLMKFGVLTLCTCRLIIVISFWCVSPFINMECHSSSCLINVGLKTTLSKISIATPAYFHGPLYWWIFFQPFTLSQWLFL
jgi:hypothetical protein